MDKSGIVFFIFVFIICLFLAIYFFIMFKGFIVAIISNYNDYKSTFNFSDVIILDSHIGYSRSGVPHYFFVYKFSNGIIKQVEVNEQEYYDNLQKESEGL